MQQPPTSRPTQQRWVCFDIGEVLVDETRIWSTWADVLEIPRFTFMATLGACIAQGEDHMAAFARLGVPDWEDRQSEVQETFGGILPVDLYPDVLPALRDLSSAGLAVAVIGNQPERREAELRASGVEPDVMVMSDTLGAQKPSPAFFDAVMERLGAAAADISYVGDRIDNDIVPAARAGMRPVRLRRGPWGYLSGAGSELAVLTVGSLSELVDRIDEVWARS